VNSQRGISSHHPGVVGIAFADGHVTWMPETSPAAIRALLTIAGGEIVEEDQNGDYVTHPKPQQEP